MEPIICAKNYRTITKENLVERIQINDWLYILDEVNSVSMYLIVGKEKALLFDAGYGFTDFRPLIREVTDLPLYVVCSHGHDDHVFGCNLFDEAYISEDDYNLCMSNDNETQKEKQILSRRMKTPDIDELVDREEYYKITLSNCKFKFAKDGDVFDLGGITLVVYPIPGHTKGSIALYSPEKKAIFTGDSLMKNSRLVYGQALEISGTPQQFIGALSRISKLDIDSVWPAHGDAPVGKELISDTRDMLIDWAHNGDPAKDMPKAEQPAVRIFGDPKNPPAFYRYKYLVMSYHLGHLKQIRDFMAENNGAVE